MGSRTTKGHNILSVLDSDSAKPQDLVGEDNGLLGMRCQLLKWDSVAMQWVRWDGRIDTIVGGDLIVSVDDVEDKLDDLINQGFASTNNSTTIPLNAGIAFTGTADDFLNYSVALVAVYADVEGTLSIQQSSDGTNWRWTDDYTIEAGANESYVIQKVARYIRVVYTNGASNQATFDLSVILNRSNTRGSSHRLGDTVSSEDDVEVIKSVLAYRQSPDDIYNNIDVQTPLPTDGDSVYCKDVWIDESDIGNFSGDVCDLLDNLHSVITDITANNPKEITIHFNRTVVSNVVGLGAYSGNFSNTEIQIGTSGGGYLTVIDESADNTDYTSRTFQLPVTAGFNAIKLRFHTTDTVTLSNLVILKTTGVVARLQAVKPDDTITDINATAGGNLKISLEELESGISSNSNSQLNVTAFDSTGSEIDFATSDNQINGEQLTRLIDDYGFEVENTPFDEMRVATAFMLAGSNFNGNVLDTNFWSTTLTGSGSATQGGGKVELSTGTTANSTTALQSVRRARYVGGSSPRYRAVIQMGTGQADNIRRWGCFDSNDGAFFELNGTTLNIVTRKTTVDTSVAAASWNVLTFTMDTNVHTYEIYHTNTYVWFVIDGELRHIVSATTTTWSDTTSLPIRTENNNSNGLDSDILIDIRVATIYRLGEFETQPISKYQSGTTAGLILKYGSGNVHGVIISGVVQNSVVTLYDNTAASGAMIWASGAMSAQTQPFDLDMHNLPFSIGLTLTITAANSNVLVIYE